MIDNATFANATALFHTFGCKLNFAETSTIAQMMADRGIRRVAKGEVPDFIVVNTCSVTELADKKCRQTIRSYNRRYPDAAILVTGCYAQLKSEEASKLPGVVIVGGTDRKNELIDYLERWMEDRRNVCMVSRMQDLRSFSPSCSRGDRTRYFLKVQDGCDYWCTYCTIPAARGRSRSASVADIVAQAERAAAAGGKEIVITGVNIGDFGKGTDENFFQLIKALDQIDGIERYRISSIEPNLLTDEIIDFTATSRKFMPHFHIPLQSGSDAVLKLMRRHYDTALFRNKIQTIRRKIPDAFIGVDLIVGMRGETTEEFERSVDFVESLDISQLHVFTYSERPGTKALDIPHIVSQQEKHMRTRRMIEISELKHKAFASRFLGTSRPVLLEHSQKGKPMSGFTDNYLKISVDASPEMDNQLVNVRLVSYDDKNAEIKSQLLL